ncbi:Type 1 glutamine amidotransferase-like domain-containing protein [Dactylosporangium sp. CS-047395]|uniref:Type 1 glutamine amidotransferase-like domain-containing protein n=1 Tax=Dactylosporangium sp. CS-047395 TaxID=3239936 RepID=UPI003D92EE2A
MKLLLTSSGLRNPTLTGALRALVGRPTAAANVVYVPTASLAEAGDHGWLLADMTRVHALGWREFDVLELNGLPPRVVLDRLARADVIYAGGGNHYHLARSITGNGLAAGLLELLERRVWVGMSAGSMMFSRHLHDGTAGIFDDAHDLHVLGAGTVEPPFGLFDWYLKPHLDSPDFPQRDDAWADRIAARAGFPIYFIDDDTALQVDGDAVDVLTEGRWRLDNSPGSDTTWQSDRPPPI